MDKWYKCSFCVHDAGPLKQPIPNCEKCVYGSKFELKKKMTDREKYEWDRHQKLDQFIEKCGIEFMQFQLEFLHKTLDHKSTYLSMPMRHGRTAMMRCMEEFRKEIMND